MVRTLLALFAIAGCTSSYADDKKPKPIAPPETRFEREMMTRFHMHENLGLLRAIEQLLVRNKLEDAKFFARGMAEAPDEPDLGPWAKQAAEVRRRAAELAEAPGIDEAIRRSARLSAACAACHVATGVQPEFRPSQPPPDQPTIEARMLRHRWATERLWEGIVGGADDAYRAGLDVLAVTPLPFKQASEQAALARQLQRAADQARKTMTKDDVDERARRYGEMLVTCAACHATQATQSAQATQSTQATKSTQATQSH